MDHKLGGDIRRSIEMFTVATVTHPTRPIPPPPTSEGTIVPIVLLEMDIYMEEVKEYVKQRRCLTSHNQKLYTILWGQSTESIHVKVEARPVFNQIRMDSDGICLLNEIQIITLNVQEQWYLQLTIHQTKYNFYHLSQGKQSLEQYYQWFNMLLCVLEQTQSTLWNDPGLIQDRLTTFANDVIVPMAAEMTQAQNEAKEIYLAIAFISGADCQCHSLLLWEMENSYLQRINHYPTTLIQAYNDLNNYQPDARFMSQNPQANDGVTFNTLETLKETSSINDESLTISMFATQGQQHGGGRGSWIGHGHRQGNSTCNVNTGCGRNTQARNMNLSHVQCFQCHLFGHYASNCPVTYAKLYKCKLCLVQLSSLLGWTMNRIMYNLG